MSHLHNYHIPKNSVITIAGTVGVGKSTLTKALADALDFRTSFEKVDTNPYLDSFYADFSRWSFHLQIYFLAERYKEQKRIFEYGAALSRIALSMKTQVFLRRCTTTREPCLQLTMKRIPAYLRLW